MAGKRAADGRVNRARGARREKRLRTQRVDWDALARLDPLWAVCSQPGARGGRWSLDAFFQSGEAELASVLAHREARPARFETALDFGCGVGRVVWALAARFETVYGLDHSKGMIEAARRLTAERSTNCVFLPHQGTDLEEIASDSIDLVYSNFVLQHLPTVADAAIYIREFVRVARRGGAIVFQLPQRLPLRRRLQPRRRLYHGLRRVGFSDAWLLQRAKLHPISMIGINQQDVIAIVEAAGGSVLRVQRVDPTSTLAGNRYFVRRMD